MEEESEESYAKRMKKINYLSLAQEFAELKKMDANALPFGLTCASTLTGVSDGEDDADERSASILVSRGWSESLSHVTSWWIGHERSASARLVRVIEFE